MRSQGRGQPHSAVDIVTTSLDAAVNWARKNSFWPFPMGISCCAIELMAMIAPRYDLARFGAEVLRFSPRQSDLMIVAGTLTYKMAPVVKRLYDQMPEPKWVIAQGACLVSGGMFDSYSTVQGLDRIIPVDVYVPGCPPRPDAIIGAILKVQRLAERESMFGRGRRQRRYEPQHRLPPLDTPHEKSDPDHVLLNIGPSHPATHGVLRLVAELDGETVVRLIPHIGYLHRAYEKIGEHKTYHQFTTYTDRLDYLAPMSNNVAWMAAVEKLLGVEIPPRAKGIRTMVCEMARISSHLLALGTYALDLGALTPWFYFFHQREQLYNLFEKLCGARFTTSYTRAGGVARDLSPALIPELKEFMTRLPRVLDDYETLLTRNRIFVDRLRGIGVLSKEMALAYGITGPNLRASGVPLDKRRYAPYLLYDQLEFDIPVGEKGDAYDRYLVRLEEIRQSLRLLWQLVDHLPAGAWKAELPEISLPPRPQIFSGMEELIYQFKITCDGYRPPPGEVYESIENPKGELGFYLRSHGEAKPFRVRIKSPSFYNLQVLPLLAQGHKIPDLVAIIASLDPVMGECDR